MQVYTLPDGTTVHATDQFTIGNQRYPAGWLERAPAADIAAAGITVSTVADPPPPPPGPPTSVQVNSTATPALSSVYAFDAMTQAKMAAVVDYILQNGRFPDSLSPFPWPDATGTMHMFASTAQFQSLATALADYVTALTLGQTPGTPIVIP